MLHLGLLLLDLNIYFDSINFPYFDALYLLGLFCFVWGITTNFVNRLQIHDMWRTRFRKGLREYKYDLLNTFFLSY